ncbi:ParA family protein [Candidatus Falkowbacteria bacterium]|nr:ParA family protein [Candidatus Falkowbacteria bacterium]
MKKIAVINHKGGVGKTTTVINVGAGLAKGGAKVLLVDLDPQANLTSGLGVSDQEEDLYLSMVKGKSLTIVEHSPNLFVSPGTLKMADAELELFSMLAREQKLKKVLDKQSGFDYCLIDCPPSLNQLTINALVACDYVLIPMTAEFFSLKALSSITSIYQAVKENFNSSLEILGLFFNEYNKRTSLSKGVSKEVESSFGEALLNATIRNNIALSESVTPPNCTSIFDYAPDSNGAFDYNKLVKEIKKRLQ